MKGMEENEAFVITESETGERLDKILVQHFQSRYSRTYFQYLIDQKLVLANGLPVKKRSKLHVGDEIEVQFALTPEIELKPEEIPLSVLYEDADILAVNKPAGLVVHPGAGNWSGTFVNALLHYCQISHDFFSLRPGIVHRLDKESSGILLAAKTLSMQQKFIELFSSRQIYKEYIAICIGCPPEGEIQAPIGRHPIHRKQMAVISTGKEAKSFCKIVAYNEKFSVVQIVIATGRTHQIRVHLKHIGHPIVGDSVYGNSSLNHYYGINRQLLHARIVRFLHPLTKQEMTLVAPFPEDMTHWINKICGSVGWPKTINT
jgi:23S rRNA pseudouridine1911/1915/1917 synthase